ncbi:hypothetical protein [Geothrix oryzisoli]|uniref:hypothetical protein n=1 Tax=Geothrix oryzisoli TaxID=2922721 RepID=UPI001FAE6A19|nr:hypothetical protein [Geothrix oryzisoli]
MRVQRLFAPFLILATSLALHAQVEPNLQTATDLSDVYQSRSGSSTLVLILDSTTASRGVFESFDYLTNKARRAFLGANNGMGGNPSPGDVGSDTVFSKPGPAGTALNRTTPILGYVFGIKRSGTRAEVRMYTWPSGAPLTVRTAIGGNTEVVGYPQAYSGSGTAMTEVAWNTDALTTLRNNGSPVTHIRFTINSRTIDLPCPWRIHDSTSAVAQPPAPTKEVPFPPIQAYQRNFQRNQTYQSGHTGIPYDVYSDQSANATRTILGYADTIIGQFYYSPDYLAWIFYGKSIRGAYALTGNKAGTVDWTANSYGYAGGYAVPTVTDTVTISDGSTGTTTAKGEGFANHLPNMTRLQAEKAAVINAFIDKLDKATWYYRFLAPAYGDPNNDEELTSSLTAYATPSSYQADRSGAETNPNYLSDLRQLTLSLLTSQTSALQTIGAKDMVGTQAVANSSFGSNLDSLDAYTPEPLAVALANTYRKIVRDTTKFATGDCSGKIFVAPISANGMNDSLTLSGDQKAAYNGNSAGYYSYTHGNTGLSKGGINYPDANVTSAMQNNSFAPGSDYFHPATMSASAAFGLPGVTNNTSAYDAPWNDPVTKKTRGIQTMCISLAVPGTYVLASDNNGRNPHEEFFDVAQWGNPSNKRWSPSNPAPSSDLIYFYQPANANNVRYFPSADPASLEQALFNIGNFIVYGKAALSAPATPATGIQNANQAYFGTFQTTASTSASDRVPLWAGNLYAIGLQRTVIPGVTAGSVQSVFKFYGINDGTKKYETVNNVGTNTADFDVLNLWSAYIVFGKYQNTTVNTEKILGGAALSWKNRSAYIMGSPDSSTGGRDIELYVHSDNGTTDNAAQLSRIISWITVKDPTNRYYLSSMIRGGGASPTNDDARNLMRFLLGAFEPTDNANLLNRDKFDTDNSKTTKPLLGHLNIMGDIVNSAPQAVELSKDLADTLPDALKKDDFYTNAYDSTQYTDPHTRLILVGTNTGHLHCFVEVAAKSINTLTNPDGFYTAKAYELWTFIPPNLFPMLWDLYNQKTQTDATIFKHHYGVDGDPVLFHVDKAPSGAIIGDTRVSVGEDAAIIFSFRKGARDYFTIKISDSSNSATTPSSPHLAWWIRPITGDLITSKLKSSSQASLLRTMGMSTSVPSFGYVKDKNGALTRVVFITGGYTNTEINTRYKNDDAIQGTSYFGDGLGRLVMALNPMTGEHVRENPWDFRATAVGAIAGGVVPVEVLNLGTGLTHRIYFGDFTGSVWALNADKSATASGYRADLPDINAWYSNDKVRLIYSDPKVRFTTAPDAFRLPGDFPVLMAAGTSSTRPLTVMVSIGSGDRNNPIDAPEDFTYVDKNGVTQSVSPTIAEYNRFYTFADLQNSSGALDIATLQKIDSSWATSYSDPKVTPGSSSYLWGSFSTATNTGSNYHYGYYLDLPHNDSTNALLAPAGNSPNRTRDKVLVSPLIKQGSLFYSLYNVYGSSGFGCSPFSTTRTFRQCDITRPLYFDPEIDVTSSKVGDTNGGGLNKSTDGCSGLAFTFNSLSSQLVDAGDYVMQGGAKASTETNLAGSNTPDIQAVKDTESNPGFRLRSWRVVR